MTIRDLDRLTVMKQYTDGRDDTYIQAANPHLSTAQIVEIRSAHGYPRVDAMAKAVTVLQRRVDEANTATIPPAQHTGPPAANFETFQRPSSNTSAVRPSAVQPSTQQTQAGTPPSDSYAQLLARAAQSPKARTRTLAEKIEQQLADLRRRLDDDEQSAAEAARKERERKAALAEVAAAEKALKDARDKLRKFKNHPGGNGKATVTRTPANRAPGGVAATSSLDDKRQHQADILTRHSVTAADVRQWAWDNKVDCGANGMLPARVLDAYDQAHQDQAAS